MGNAKKLDDNLTIEIPPEYEKHYSLKDVLSGTLDSDMRFMDEYASLSAIVYGDNQQPVKGWVRANSRFDAKYGLKAVGFYKLGKNNKVYAALVFRGTRGIHPIDWLLGNWAIVLYFFKNNYYQQVKRNTKKFIAELRKELAEGYPDADDIIFAAAGHSLGGGLAQTCGYSNNDVTKVYAFNSSWITFYTTMKRSDWLENCKGLKVFRFIERGEILRSFRTLTEQTYKFDDTPNVDPKFITMKVNFNAGWNPIRDHSIDAIADGLSAVRKALT
jgi:hypothetical protein